MGAYSEAENLDYVFYDVLAIVVCGGIRHADPRGKAQDLHRLLGRNDGHCTRPTISAKGSVKFANAGGVRWRADLQTAARWITREK